jgi:transaldolase/glucose-6-phosphate isomerase
MSPQGRPPWEEVSTVVGLLVMGVLTVTLGLIQGRPWVAAGFGVLCFGSARHGADNAQAAPTPGRRLDPTRSISRSFGPLCVGCLLGRGYDGRVAIAVAAQTGFEDLVERRLGKLAEEEVVARIWDRDHTVWREEPDEIADRLGWLDAPRRARAELEDLRAFAREAASEGLTHAVILGMGGSSLAPEVFAQVFGSAPGMLEVSVLDTTHPDAIAAFEASQPMDRTLFVVSSKSGTTVETLSHMAYFWDRLGDGSHFVAVTDPGTPLEAAASELGFRRVFTAPEDVGGRYSALTTFGLLPAALLGVDLEAVLDEAERAADACRAAPGDGGNPGAFLGAMWAEAAAAGRDKLTLTASAGLAPVGAWVEQLVAESTGKDGIGILPVDGERPGSGGDDRMFLGIGEQPAVEPWAALSVPRPESLGGAFFVLELATAVAGHIMGIQPFDQPDVQSAKDRTAEVLAGGVPEQPEGDLDALLGQVRHRDYVAIQAFVPPSDETWAELQAARARIGDGLGVATTLGYGPRYLHSTGQLHKGGPDTGVFVQVFQEPKEDSEIPGEGFTFGRLIAAQAAGDLAALRDRGRRVSRVSRDALVAWGS